MRGDVPRRQSAQDLGDVAGVLQAGRRGGEPALGFPQHHRRGGPREDFGALLQRYLQGDLGRHHLRRQGRRLDLDCNAHFSRRDGGERHRRRQQGQAALLQYGRARRQRAGDRTQGAQRRRRRDRRRLQPGGYRDPRDEAPRLRQAGDRRHAADLLGDPQGCAGSADRGACHLLRGHEGRSRRTLHDKTHADPAQDLWPAAGDRAQHVRCQHHRDHPDVHRCRQEGRHRQQARDARRRPREDQGLRDGHPGLPGLGRPHQLQQGRRRREGLLHRAG